jgi:predicted N-formylglutamate amidohydrolase
MEGSATALLDRDDPQPVGIEHAGDCGPILVTVDHGGRAVPKALGSLGVSPEDMQRHIAWDIGALEVGRRIARAFKSPLIHQRYSRLVVDCNRQPFAADSIPLISENTVIPGNATLSAYDRERRLNEILVPYHLAITHMLDSWTAPSPVVVAVHSFTPIYKGVHRLTELGVIFGDDSSFSALVSRHAKEKLGNRVAENEPYRVDMVNDYTVPVHAESRHLPYVEFEIRQDLLSTEDDISSWASMLINILEPSLNEHKATI